MGKSGTDKLNAWKKRQKERAENSNPGTIWSRPDPVTGKRKDITAERTNLTRKQKEKLAGGVKKKLETGATVPVTSGPVSSRKEYVFEFSRPINSAAAKYVSKLVKLIGGKQAYIED